MFDGASVLKKLRLAKTHKILIVNAPAGFTKLLADVAYDTSYKPANKGSYDYVQVFVASYDELVKFLKQVEGAGKHDCLFWACYPKVTGTIKSDLKRELVWQALGTIGLDAVAQVALDDTWSALRGRPFVR